MTRNIYALLVGIERYFVGVGILQGSVNDIEASEQYLQEWVAKGRYKLHLQILKDTEATHQAILAVAKSFNP